MNDAPASRPPLDATALGDPHPPWTRIEVLQRTPSTNAVIAERARGGEPEGLVVVTEHQTEGRGRLGRSWVTPPHAALTFSVLLRPRVTPERWPWLPLLAGVAAAEGVRRATGVECRLKWPNDLLCGAPEKHAGKVAGILVERVETSDGAAAVVGVGINVTTTEEELPVPTATSLVLAGASATDRTSLLASVLHVLGTKYAAWAAVGGDPDAGLHAEYSARCATLGRVVRVDLPTGVQVVGEAVALGADGGLELRTDAGRVRVSAGDVVHVR